jgi:hypothetical protein
MFVDLEALGEGRGWDGKKDESDDEAGQQRLESRALDD